MIENIKIFGERNSGTRFIQELIKKNVKKINILSPDYNRGTGWKHGTPKLNKFKNIINKTLFVFIIRDLEPWLKSMYKTPHHLKKSDNIKSFLNNKIISIDGKPNHDVNIYKQETNKTIFELRYYKINSYINTFKKVKNAIIVNLENLKQDNGKNFINTLHDKFQIAISSNIHPIFKKFSGNGTDNVDNAIIILDSDIINDRKEEKIENYVEGLKEKYNLKSGGVSTKETRPCLTSKE